MRIDDMTKINEGEHYIKLLSKDDMEIVQSFCERCTDYYEIVHGTLPPSNSAEEILIELPPGKDEKDKYVLGVFNSNDLLVGIVDIVKDYPVEKEWIIGLLMIDPSERRIGLASKVHDFLVEWTTCMGAEKLRIAVAEQNVDAMKFWVSLGYKELKRISSVKIGEKENTLIVMNYHL
jgi:GNAT superfamily N-acetyltransferase